MVGWKWWYPEAVAAPGFIAIGSGPAGVSAAETFRGRHADIPVRILTADPALPYAKPLELAALPNAQHLMTVIHETLDAVNFRTGNGRR